MEYIASRGFDLPKPEEKWSSFFWFSMWERKRWPYEELLKGDIIYWYETPHKKLVLKSLITKVERFQYKSKDEAAHRLSGHPNFDNNDAYFVNAPNSGYCLAWVAKPLKQLNIAKPKNITVPRTGWLRVNENISLHWLKQKFNNDKTAIDDIASGGSLHEQLENLNEKMAELSPTRRKSIIEQTIRGDSLIIRKLKQLCQFRCQFPDCNIGIPKKDGGYYAEAAHIEPVYRGGKSILGNLLILCPNHHKEFDLGEREIFVQTTTRVTGRLNGKPFDITLPNKALKKE